MHLKNERYFVIAGFITNELHKVISTHKRIEKIVKIRKKIDLKEKIELKSTKININQQALFINALYNISKVIPIAIIIDKYNLSKFNASENMAYNYFVKNLLNYLFKCDISLLTNNKLELRVDNRNNSVKTLKDLETFLSWEFDEFNIDVKYLDSKINRDIQMADYIANMFWKYYNLKNEKLSKKIPKIKMTKISKFPVKIFGNNPSINQKTML
jgi:hypothetical protein